MDDVTLAEREHLAYLNSFEVMAESVPNGSVTRFGEVVAVVTHSPMALFNHVLIEGPTASLDDLQSAIAAVKQTGLPFMVSLRVGRDEHFADSMRSAEFTPADIALPAMALHPLLEHRPRGDLEIRSGIETHADHCLVASEGFGIPIEHVESMMTPAMARRDDVRFYTGYLNGEPVASSLGLLHERSITVFNVATLPEHRGRGYGATMTNEAVLGGKERGCEVAFLQSSAMGLSLYQRLGFRTIVEYDQWTPFGG